MGFQAHGTYRLHEIIVCMAVAWGQHDRREVAGIHSCRAEGAAEELSPSPIGGSPMVPSCARSQSSFCFLFDAARVDAARPLWDQIADASRENGWQGSVFSGLRTFMWLVE